MKSDEPLVYPYFYIRIGDDKVSARWWHDVGLMHAACRDHMMHEARAGEVCQAVQASDMKDHPVLATYTRNRNGYTILWCNGKREVKYRAPTRGKRRAMR